MNTGREILQALKPLEGDFKAQLDALAAKVEGNEKAVRKLEAEGRNLSISIVGAVKSGKSSLLNALLFNGESVLPKAATPMTAALTYIRYTPEKNCRAEIEFFTAKEWEKMESFAREYERIYAESEAKLRQEDELAERRGERRREVTRDRVIRHSRGRLTEEYVSAKELVDSVRNSRLDVSRYLKNSEANGASEVISAATPGELVDRMRDYVGADGRFTPIVCSTTIYLNDKRLEGFEIVDTPGTNDPVIFRGARTSQSLGSTDAVMAVSTASQFFQQSDLELLSEILPRKGVKNFVLVASQYDRAVSEMEDEIDDDLPPQERLIQTALAVEEKLSENYRKRITEIANAAAKGDGDGERWEKLVSAEPTCVSALAYSLACRWGHWTQAEKDEFEKFNELIEGFAFRDAEMLRQFSKIGQVKEQLDAVMARKREIVAESVAAKEAGFRKDVADFLRELQERLEGRINTLETNDVASLRKKLKDQTRALKAGEENIKSVFEDFRYDAHKIFFETLSAMRQAKNGHAQLNVRTEVQTHEYTHDRGCGFLWWRSLTGTRYETRTRTVRTRYANTYDAVNQVEAYVEEARKELEETIMRVTDRKVLRRKLSETVLELLQGIAGSEPDLALLKAQLQSVVGKIDIPDVDFGNLDYTRMITEAFEGGEVTNEKVDKLQSLQRDALQRVLVDLEKKVAQKSKEIETSIVVAGASFAKQLIAELSGDTDRDVEELKDKENALKRLKGHLQLVRQIVQEI